MTPKQDGKRRVSPVFLLGPAGSGKTRRCIDSVLTSERAGETAYYLVPEQSTYLADRQLLEPPGPKAIRHARVVSFRRLAFLLEKQAPNGAIRTLDQAGRRIILRALFSELPDELRTPFDRVFDRPGFLEGLIATVRELRFEIGPATRGGLDHLDGSDKLPDELQVKLRMLARLIRAYEETLAARGLRDPDLVLFDAPSRIREEPEMFRGVPVMVDGFLSFTGLETEILLALVQVGANLTVSLCLDRDVAGVVDELMPSPPDFRIREWPTGMLRRIGKPVFLAPLRTFAELRARIHAAGMATRTDFVEAPKKGSRFHSTDLEGIEDRLLCTGEPRVTKAEDVRLIAARDPSHEVEVWARQIDRWIRLDEDPVRPGEIAIILRDLEMYRPLVVETFARFNIPVFIDRYWDITARPFVRTILDAVEVLRTGWQRETVLAFLRSPLLGVRGGEIDLVENLSLEAGYDYEQWIGDPWLPLRRPARTRYVKNENEEIEEKERSIDSTENRIEKVRVGIANRVRATQLEPLANLWSKWRSDRLTGAEAVDALREWITVSRLRERTKATRDVSEADAIRECEAAEGVLEQIASEVKSEPLTLDGFARILFAGLGSLKLGRTPTGLDCVNLVEIQRSRLGEVRRAIVGGLSARDFPRTISSGRFFNEQEREKLAALGLDLGTPDLIRQEEEAYFLYIALTRASDRLLLTRPATDLEGSSLEPSPFVREIRRAYTDLVEESPENEMDPADLQDIQTAEELAARVGAYVASRLDRRLAGRPHDPSPAESEPSDRRILTAYNELLEADAATAQGHVFLDQSSRLWGYDNRPVLPESVLRAVGRERAIPTSAGRLEAFARCPYQHFARHMLRLERRPQSEVTPLESGLLAHRALEVLYRQGVPPTDRREIDRTLKKVFDHIKNEEELRAYQVDPSGRFRLRSTRGQLARFLELEARRLEKSDFKPDRFEQDFGAGKIRPLRIELPDGGELLLRGRIDRIDTAKVGDSTEALILDYKSSDPYRYKRGRPLDVDAGLDLQLAVYLLVAEEILEMKAVGGLYVPVLPRPISKPPKDPENKLEIKMIGLLAEDRLERVTGKLKVIRGARDRENRLKDRDELSALLDRARITLATYGTALRRGCIDIAPVVRGGSSPCDLCDYAAVCRVDEEYNPSRSSPLDGLE